jgi:hypothetical protein
MGFNLASHLFIYILIPTTFLLRKEFKMDMTPLIPV